MSSWRSDVVLCLPEDDSGFLANGHRVVAPDLIGSGRSDKLVNRSDYSFHLHRNSLLECIRMIDEVTGRKTEVRMADGRFGDLLYFVCDIERARRKLQWQPTIRPNEGVPLLIEWAEQNRHLFQTGESK